MKGLDDLQKQFIHFNFLREASLSLIIKGKELHITMKDTEIRISPDEHGRIFERFIGRIKQEQDKREGMVLGFRLPSGLWRAGLYGHIWRGNMITS